MAVHRKMSLRNFNFTIDLEWPVMSSLLTPNLFVTVSIGRHTHTRFVQMNVSNLENQRSNYDRIQLIYGLIIQHDLLITTIAHSHVILTTIYFL